MASKSKNGIEAANGKFRFVFRADGEKVRGAWVDSHKEAKRLEGEKKAELRNVGSAINVVGTVASLIDIYVERCAINAKTGTAAWGSTKGHELRRIQNDELVGQLAVRDITKNRIMRWGELLAQTLSQNTVLTRISYLNKALRTAANRWADEGLCNSLICAEVEAGIELLREEELAGPSIARTKMPTREEVEAVRAAAKGSTSYVDLVAVTDVLSRLPLRLGELCKITKGDLVDDQRAIWLRSRKHPNRRIKERNDELVAFIVDPITGIDSYELVKARLSGDAEPTDLPFAFEAQDVSRAWAAAAAKAKVEDFHLHDLRAFSISNLLGGGIDSLTVAKISGHRNPKTMSERYARMSAKTVAATIRNNFKQTEALTAADIRTMIATLQRELALAEAREAASGPQLKLAA